VGAVPKWDTPTLLSAKEKNSFGPPMILELLAISPVKIFAPGTPSKWPPSTNDGTIESTYRNKRTIFARPGKWYVKIAGIGGAFAILFCAAHGSANKVLNPVGL
jgi:hypothetical protein